MNARRDVLRNLALAATAGVLRIRPTLAAAAEPPPETRTLRLGQLTGICIAPQYIAEEFLHGEGFTQVQYVKEAGRVATNKALATRRRRRVAQRSSGIAPAASANSTTGSA